MALPNVKVTPADGNLGLASEQDAGTFAMIGTGSAEGSLAVNGCALVTDADQVDALVGAGNNDLEGPLKASLLSGARQIVAVRAATEAGGTVGPLTRTSAGALIPDPSPIRTAGTGTGALTLTGTPAVKGYVDLEIMTGGEPGDAATFRWRLVVDGVAGEWSAETPVTSSVALGATGVTAHFAVGDPLPSYADADAWLSFVTNDGGSMALAVTGVPTQSRAFRVVCTKSGGLNDAEFIVIVDGEPSLPQTAQATQTLYGLLFTFSGAGDPALVVGDQWTFETAAAVASLASLSAAVSALAASAYADAIEWIGIPAETDDATWVALAALVETEFTAKHRFVHLVCAAPGPLAEETVDEWVARLLAMAASVSHPRLSVVAARFMYTNPDTGLTLDVNALPIYCGRLAQVPIQRSVGAPVDGALPLATVLSPATLEANGRYTELVNDGHIELLDATGKYVTLRRIAGLSGLYVTNGRMMVSATSDYRWVEYRRVMDEACREVRLAGLSSLHLEGDEPGIEALKADLQAPLNRMVAAGKITSGAVTIPAGQDVIGTGTVRVKVRIQPRPAMRYIEVEIGLSNPYLNAVE